MNIEKISENKFFVLTKVFPLLSIEIRDELRIGIDERTHKYL